MSFRCVRFVVVILFLLKSLTAFGRTTERVDLLLADGTIHSALVSFPSRTQKPLPVMIILGGFKTGEKSLGMLRNDLNIIYATTDYPYKKPGERSFTKDLNQIPLLKQAVHRTDLAADALIKKLLFDKRVDQKRITIIGASFGAPFAITAAHRNAEIDGVILIHGFGRVDLGIAQQLVNEWGSWSYPMAWLVGKGAWSYLNYKEPEMGVQELHAHQKVYYLYSNSDEQLPPESIDSLKNALAKSRAKVEMTRTTGGHLGPGRLQILSELIEMSLIWLRNEKLI